MPFDAVPLAASSTSIPGITFGTGSEWRTSPRAKDEATDICDAVVDAVKAAVKAGFRSFDSAEYYDTETSLGKGLKECGVPRSELFIMDKFARPESMKDIRGALLASLKKLGGLDYLDLYCIHTPMCIKEDNGDSFLSVWRQLEALVDEGLIRAIGVSNFEPKHFEQFIGEARIKPALNQISIYPYIYHRTLPDIEYCQKHGIAVQAYEISSSLLRASEKDGPIDSVVNAIASELSKDGKTVSAGQVLLQWASAKGFAIVTTTSKPSRMEEYLGAGDFRLTSEQVAAIDAAGQEGAQKGHGKHSTWNGVKV